MHQNEAYMKEEMSETAVEALPPEYTHMKGRLQNTSSLYNMQTSPRITKGASKNDR